MVVNPLRGGGANPWNLYKKKLKNHQRKIWFDHYVSSLRHFFAFKDPGRWEGGRNAFPPPPLTRPLHIYMNYYSAEQPFLGSSVWYRVFPVYFGIDRWCSLHLKSEH